MATEHINPVVDAKGHVQKVIKFATDTTAEKLRTAEFEAKMNAIAKVQAVIEFLPSGEVLVANDIFLSLLGYRLEDIVGKHHSMFVEPSFAKSPDYRDFWAKLNKGEFVASSFKRIGAGGKEVWIQASYNPIFDLNGHVVKVVKYASDITDLTEIGVGLVRLADNDLQYRIERPFIPAFENLRRDFNASMDKLQSVMQQVVESTVAINSGTQEIATASDDMARRTEQQAAGLEETAAALEEVTSTVNKTADGATHANQVVIATKADAEGSSQVVRQTVEAMSGIESSSRQIIQIISVIDEIAFQTNLLALNAGVEAARAGDAGRGFAVVAQEVRALAQRSAEAAKEIKTLISTSTEQVDRGVRLVGETGKSLERILAQVIDISGIVSNIAAGTKEQAIAMTSINTAVAQMDRGTQENAAMVEQSTAATHNLAEQVRKLSDLTAIFNLEDVSATPTMRRSAQRAEPPARSTTRPVQAMKTTGRGGAAPKPVSKSGSAQPEWADF